MIRSLPLFISAFTAFSFLLFSSCENDIEKVKKVTEKNNLPQQTLADVELLYSDSGRVQVQVLSPLMEKYFSEHPYLELPKGVRVFFYDNDMGVKSKLSANYAILYEK